MLLNWAGSENSVEGPTGDLLWAMDKGHMLVPLVKLPLCVPAKHNTLPNWIEDGESCFDLRNSSRLRGCVPVPVSGCVICPWPQIVSLAFWKAIKNHVPKGLGESSKLLGEITKVSGPNSATEEWRFLQAAETSEAPPGCSAVGEGGGVHRAIWKAQGLLPPWCLLCGPRQLSIPWVSCH